MWRQMLVDEAYQNRMHRALFSSLLRANRITLAAFAVLAVVMGFLAATGGEWFFAVLGAGMVAMLPLLLWRTARRMATRVPLGTYVAYAVTQDGTFHHSFAGGTTTVNPGFVARVSATGDCWLIALTNSALVVVPRELIPDADAAILVRHRPERLQVPPATKPA